MPADTLGLIILAVFGVVTIALGAVVLFGGWRRGTR